MNKITIQENAKKEDSGLQGGEIFTSGGHIFIAAKVTVLDGAKTILINLQNGNVFSYKTTFGGEEQHFKRFYGTVNITT